DVCSSNIVFKKVSVYMNLHKYALLWRDAVTPKETVVMSAPFGSSHGIRPGGRLLSRSFPTRQQFALVRSKTRRGDVGRQCSLSLRFHSGELSAAGISSRGRGQKNHQFGCSKCQVASSVAVQW